MSRFWAIAALLLVQCTADSGGNGSPRDGRRSAVAGSSNAGGAGAGMPAAAGASGGPGFGNSGSPEAAPCGPGPASDRDADGFSRAQGDCEDCNPDVHPDAEEIPDNELDEDCDGFDVHVSDGGMGPPHVSCDDALRLDSSDALDGARAIGLCSADGAAVQADVQADYTNAVGTPGLMNMMQVGIVKEFGPVMPREGASMLLLSSGIARAPMDPGYTPDCDEGAKTPSPAPEGYPREFPDCGTVDISKEIYDVAALSLTLKVPDDAYGLSVDYDFYTYEFPAKCSVYNDFFLILMDPPPPGADAGNIAFDENGNAISVNTRFMRVCDPITYREFVFDCPLGDAELAGTGFDDGPCVESAIPGVEQAGATGWLTTTVPVTPGSTITLRFVVWDTGDMTRDSSVLIDNLRWSFDAETQTMVPITRPSGPD